MLGATGSAATTSVCADAALPEPATFEAVTTTRSVQPTSAEVSPYVCATAVSMFPQFAPPESQRRHWYANEIGCVPDHVPGSADNVCPACPLPETVGTAVFTGGFPTTTTVCADIAAELPATFDPVTITRNVEFTSADPTR